MTRKKGKALPRSDLGDGVSPEERERDRQTDPIRSVYKKKKKGLKKGSSFIFQTYNIFQT